MSFWCHYKSFKSYYVKITNILLHMRLNCAGFWRQFWKLGSSGCADCVGLETSPPLTLSPKGVRVRAG